MSDDFNTPGSDQDLDKPPAPLVEEPPKYPGLRKGERPKAGIHAFISGPDVFISVRGNSRTLVHDGLTYEHTHEVEGVWAYRHM